MQVPPPYFSTEPRRGASKRSRVRLSAAMLHNVQIGDGLAMCAMVASGRKSVTSLFVPSKLRVTIISLDTTHPGCRYSQSLPDRSLRCADHTSLTTTREANDWKLFGLFEDTSLRTCHRNTCILLHTAQSRLASALLNALAEVKETPSSGSNLETLTRQCLVPHSSRDPTAYFCITLGTLRQ
jgi:hypothetical protein